MAVYVDRATRIGRDAICRLVADTLDELHGFAARIGVKRAQLRWYGQAHSGGWPYANSAVHYEIAPTERSRAIACGAMGLSRRQMAGWLCPR